MGRRCVDCATNALQICGRIQTKISVHPSEGIEVPLGYVRAVLAETVEECPDSDTVRGAPVHVGIGAEFNPLFQTVQVVLEIFTTTPIFK